MSEKTKTAEVAESEEDRAGRSLEKNRRYIGSRETRAYILYDIAQSFNIDARMEYFTNDILVIAFRWQTIISGIVGVWDIINDLFLASLVDRTNTRFGKFKPYLILYAGPGAVMGMIFWSMPLIFPGAPAAYLPKIFLFFILKMLQNLNGSMYGIAKTGILSTITPDRIDRTRLINQANLISSLVERWPEYLVKFGIDAVNREIIPIKMTSLFAGFGVFTALFSSLFGLYFAIIYRERVLQSVEKPTQKEAITSLFKSRPLMMMALSSLLSRFGLSVDMSTYYIQVLNVSSMEIFVGIPGMFATYASYTYVDKLRERFSTKSLWILGEHLGDLLVIPVFIFGSINKNFKKPIPIGIALAIHEFIWNLFYALRKVIPQEIQNEVIDYSEWKFGYRTEGMTGVMQGLAAKVVGTFGAMMKSIIYQMIGYRQGLKPGQQTERTEYLLFFSTTLLPIMTGSLGIIPKFFYNINEKTRKRMYAELEERRREIAQKLNSEEETPEE